MAQLKHDLARHITIAAQEVSARVELQRELAEAADEMIVEKSRATDLALDLEKALAARSAIRPTQAEIDVAEACLRRHSQSSFTPEELILAGAVLRWSTAAPAEWDTPQWIPVSERLSAPSAIEPSEIQVEGLARLFSESPLIDAPKLPPVAWMGFARHCLEYIRLPTQRTETLPTDFRGRSVSNSSSPFAPAEVDAPYDRVLQLTKALEQCVRVTREWHAMPQKPGDDDAFDIYFNHSPEMKLIREALGKMPDQTERDDGPDGKQDG